MIRFSNLFAIARSELRLTRRLVRYWVFLALAGLFAMLGYLQVGFLHGFLSTYSSTVAALSPRFMIGFLGLRFLLIFTVGVVFLGFDVRARDLRERMVEVLDSRPFTNLELLGGRFIALILAGWIPLVLVTLLVDGIGALLQAFRVPFGSTIEPVSLVAFVVFMALPAFAFAIGLVFLITLLVRHRLIAAVLLLAALGGMFWGTLWLPLTYGPFFDLWGAYMVDYPSDMIPGIADSVGWLQRLAVFLAGLGFIGLAAGVHPRLDGGSRGSRFGGGAALIAVALVLMTFGWTWRSGDVQTLERWKLAHEARLSDPAPDITSVTAEVTVVPAGELAVQIELAYRAAGDSGLETALFSFNPGLEVVEASDSSGRAVAFRHEDGLLELETPLEAGGGQVVRLNVVGEVDPLFGYLDGAEVPEALAAMDGAIYMLGFLKSINDGRFVGLMPGSCWLPVAGSDVRRDDPDRNARDYYELDLTVNLPDGWLAAAPGRREVLEGAVDASRFRFAPVAPVHEVALMAARYESVSMEVEDVHCELLLHPSHLANLEVLEDAVGELKTEVEDILREAAEAGFDYPYTAFTMVEVPTALRGYSGGWRMDSAMAPPSMMLVRESGFPSARFDVAFRKPERFADREGGMPRAMRDRMNVFFRNDFSGGNLFSGVARSFFLHQTCATGQEGLALNFALEELASLTVTGDRGYFSAHIFDRDMGEAIQGVLMNMGNVREDPNVADSMIGALTSRPAVWDAVLEAPLGAIDPWDEPERTLNALTLKAGAMSSALYDTLGRESLTALLVALRAEHRGGTFDLADVVAAANGLDVDLGPLVDAWMTTTELPGFVGVEAHAYRLEDGDGGSPRYQLLATLRNDRPVEGMFRFSYRVGSEDDVEEVESEPIRLGGQSTLRWGTVVSRPPLGVFVQPYLALNRIGFRIPMDPLDEEKIVDDEPIEGVEDVEWVLPENEYIVVDDLDDGFSVVTDENAGGFRLLGRDSNGDEDAGLPVARPGRMPNKWSRGVSMTAWGEYRHTIAYIKPGKGRTRAVFTTTLPHAGSWDLEIHLCHKERFRRAQNWGTWTLEVKDESDGQSAEFDAASAPRGWNLVGAFDLVDGEVSVKLSDQTAGKVVIADAIRWVPSGDRAGDEDLAIAGGDDS